MAKIYTKCHNFSILLDNICARCYLSNKIPVIHLPLLRVIHISKDGVNAGIDPARRTSTPASPDHSGMELVTTI